MTDRFGVVYTIGPRRCRQPRLGGHRRRPDLRHARRWQDWNNVTPPAMTAWSKVSQIEAGHFDAETAYASVDRHRLADNKPYIYRTHDGGKTWQNVAAGIPEGAYVNSVKEDTKRRACSTPPPSCASTSPSTTARSGSRCRTTCRSLRSRHRGARRRSGIATHGRGFWVMDQMARCANRRAGSADRFRQRLSLQARRDLRHPPGGMNGTPLPHEEPQELNPPRAWWCTTG
jgi:hypothetical protein